jgi:hypothetical protein
MEDHFSDAATGRPSVAVFAVKFVRSGSERLLGLLFFFLGRKLLAKNHRLATLFE